MVPSVVKASKKLFLFAEATENFFGAYLDNAPPYAQVTTVLGYKLNANKNKYHLEVTKMYTNVCICEICKNYKLCKEDWWLEQHNKPILSAFDDVTFEEAMADLDDCEEYEAP